MINLEKLTKSNQGFSLVQLITILGIVSILGIISIPNLFRIIKFTEKTIAANSIKNIKIECEGKNYLNKSLDFTPAELIGYEFDNGGKNNCSGNEKNSLISILAHDTKNQPSFLYDFKSGEISCYYEGSEASEFPECEKIPLSERKKYTCSDIGDWSKAQQLLESGHSYLDRDNDGEACEVLGRNSDKPEYGEVTIEDCYDGDTCTTSDGEKIRLACIDTPEIRGKGAKPNEAKAARDFLNELIKGKRVSIRRVTEDRYGRTVGELSINGKNIQEFLVKKGYAEIYEKYAKSCKWAT